MGHVPVPTVRGGVLARLASLVFGLFLCGLAIVCVLESELGLSPWDVLHQGIAKNTPLSFGGANIVVGVAVLATAWRLGAKIGLGTFANAVLIGAFVDLLTSTGAIPSLEDAGVGGQIALLALGILLFGIGTGFYIGAGMGAGPRDSLMLIVAGRARTRVGVARAAIELSALVVGFVLGGTVGVGTVAFALLIGPAVELGLFLIGRSPLAITGTESVSQAA